MRLGVFKRGLSTLSNYDHLYGAAPVLSALTESKRHFLRLYLADPNPRDPNAASQEVLLAKQLAQEHHLEIVYKPKKKLDALTQDRPHQGLVLQASKLYIQQLRGLGHFPIQESDQPIDYDGWVSKKESFPLSFLPRSRRSFPFWLGTNHLLSIL